MSGPEKLHIRILPLIISNNDLKIYYISFKRKWDNPDIFI